VTHAHRRSVVAVLSALLACGGATANAAPTAPAPGHYAAGITTTSSVDPIVWGKGFHIHNEPLAAIACPSRRLCVVVGGFGNKRIYISHSANHGPSTWKSVKMPDDFAALACPSTTECVAAASHALYVSRDPSHAKPSAWHKIHLADSQGSAAAVSCPSTRFCLVSGLFANWTSSSPMRSRSWKRHKHSGYISLSCATRVCLGRPGHGRVATLTRPGTKQVFKKYDIDHHRSPPSSPPDITTNYCVGSESCLVGDEAGYVFGSRFPTGGASNWTQSNVDNGGYITDVYCESSSFCLSFDDSGRVRYSDSAFDAQPAWSTPATLVKNGDYVAQASCSSSSFCATLSGFDRVVLGYRKTGAAR
jgi:hypothetical protein